MVVYGCLLKIGEAAMLEQLNYMRVQFQMIRTAALQINQPMLAYLAEMGIAERTDQMNRMRGKPGI